jgi:hypothetical protein
LGAYYTFTSGLGVASSAPVTFTHALSITPASLVARIIPHQVLQTNTAPLMVGTIGTNIVSVQSATGTLQTFDLEVQFIHSIIVG